MRLPCQQVGAEVMFWLGNIRNRMICSFKMQTGVKINAITYNNFFSDVLTDWLDEFPLSKLSKVSYMHVKSPTHTAKEKQQVLSLLRFKE